MATTNPTPRYISAEPVFTHTFAAIRILLRARIRSETAGIALDLEKIKADRAAIQAQIDAAADGDMLASLAVTRHQIMREQIRLTIGSDARTKTRDRLVGLSRAFEKGSTGW
jgi:hypothetical protein